MYSNLSKNMKNHPNVKLSLPMKCSQLLLELRPKLSHIGILCKDPISNTDLLLENVGQKGIFERGDATYLLLTCLFQRHR